MPNAPDEIGSDLADDIRPVVDPEEWLFAALLDMVIDHCAVPVEDKLDSFGLTANTTAMRLLAEAGYIEIDDETDDRLQAHILPAARDLQKRIRFTNGS